MTDVPPTELTLTVRRDHATMIVRVCGELDFDTCGGLTETVTAQLTDDQDPPTHVRLDFSGLTCIDSSGLSALLMVHRRTSALGATLYLDNQPPAMRRMLELTNVLNHLTAPPGNVSNGPAEA
ncbi:STAS domain-containing protein [Streptacidiphilus neutrinimicus]|uniref:STAS domain-containing protein n=1 Tax=Streptacidiphilus neutrinimicus TaxID=105420 RepID=UPI0005A7AC5B|nr:STAS domain-containing protein [Streptacidiphilus neutrinimicus]